MMALVMLAEDSVSVLGPNTLIPVGAIVVIVGAYAWFTKQFQDLKDVLTAHSTRMEKIEAAHAVRITHQQMELWIARFQLANPGKEIVVPSFPERIE